MVMLSIGFFQCGRITGPIIFSWEMASWPILFDDSFLMAKSVLLLSICLKLKGVMFGAGGWGVCRAASRSKIVSGV